MAEWLAEDTWIILCCLNPMWTKVDDIVPEDWECMGIQAAMYHD